MRHEWKELEAEKEKAGKSTSEELKKLQETVERLEKGNINPR